MSARRPKAWTVFAAMLRSGALRYARMFAIAKARKEHTARRKTKKSSSPLPSLPNKVPKTTRRGSSPVTRRRGRGLTFLMVLLGPIYIFNSLQIGATGATHLRISSALSALPGEVLFVDRGTLRELRWKGPKIDWQQVDQPATDPPPPPSWGSPDYAAAKLRLEAHRKHQKMHREARRLRESIEEEGDDPTQVVSHYRRHGLDGFVTKSPGGFIELVKPPQPLATRIVPTFAKAAATLIAILIAILVFANLSSTLRQIGRSDGTLPWLLTHPVRTPVIVLARIVQGAVTELIPWVTVFPLCISFFLVADRSIDTFAAIGISLLATLTISFTTASISFYLETLLQLRCSLRRIQSVQAFAAMGGLLLFGLLFLLIMSQRAHPQWMAVVGHISDLIFLLPGAVAFAGLNGSALLIAGNLLAALAIPVTFTWLAARALSHGTQRTSGVDPGKRSLGSITWSPIKVSVRERLLVLRDKNLATQILGIPIAMTLMQAIIFSDTIEAPPWLGLVLVWMAGVICLMSSGVHMLASEGRTLGFLQAHPIALKTVFAQKARFWTGVAMVIVTFTFAIVYAIQKGDSDVRQVGLLDLAFLLAGICACGWLSTGIAILGTDAAPNAIGRRMRPAYVYAFQLLAGSYVSGLVSEDFTVRIAALFVLATASFATWRKASQELPWLEDPDAKPRFVVSPFDAGISITAYFILQAILSAFLGAYTKNLAIGSAIAAAIVAFHACLRIRFQGYSVGPILGLDLGYPRRTLAWTAAGVLAGVGLGLAGIAWRDFALDRGWLPPEAVAPLGDQALTLFMFAVVLAPLIEEILFRGLFQKSLSQIIHPALALVWAAALFAVVHPSLSWLPVFALGLLTGFLAMRSRCLYPAIAAHAAYNAMIMLVR